MAYGTPPQGTGLIVQTDYKNAAVKYEIIIVDPFRTEDLSM